MSDEGEFLTGVRDLVLSGRSAYGAADNPAAVAKLQELDARIALGQKLGEIPAEEPWTVERAAKERLQQEFPGGGAPEIPEEKAAYWTSKFDALAALGDERIAALADEVTRDVGERASQITIGHAMTRDADGNLPGANEIARRLLADARIAVESFGKTPDDRDRILKLLRADRETLEYWAARGKLMATYGRRRKELGL